MEPFILQFHFYRFHFQNHCVRNHRIALSSNCFNLKWDLFIIMCVYTVYCLLFTEFPYKWFHLMYDNERIVKLSLFNQNLLQLLIITMNLSFCFVSFNFSLFPNCVCTLCSMSMRFYCVNRNIFLHIIKIQSKWPWWFNIHLTKWKN